MTRPIRPTTSLRRNAPAPARPSKEAAALRAALIAAGVIRPAFPVKPAKRT